MPELSVVIITYNEEKNLPRCLKSVKGVADDIVVLDSYSTDRTEQICRKYGARFFRHPFLGHVEQKNLAISLARYPRILSLDADEALSPRLRESILEVKHHWTHDGYYFNRKANYCGKWIRFGSWYPDRKLRLWDSRKGAWRGLNPHDRFSFYRTAKKKLLKGDLLHYSYYSGEEHLKQVRRFSDILAVAYYRSGKTAGIFRRFFHPGWRFFRDFVLKLGFLDGKAGWDIARYAMMETFLKYHKLSKLYRSPGPDKPGRVCLFNGISSWGGGEKWHFDVARKLQAKNYPILVITGWKSELNYRIRQAGLNTLEMRVTNFSFLNIPKMLRLKRIFRNQQVSTVIINQSADLKLAGPAAKMAGVERIIYRRGSAIPVRNTLSNRFLFGRIVNQVIANSEETMRTLLEKNGRLIDREHIRVIYNGIDLDEYDRTSVKEVFREDGLLMLGNAGRLSYEKGHHYLIELAVRLKELGIPFRILIAGTGELEGPLKQRARKQGVDQYVRFLGFVDNMKAFYRSIDIFLLTSLWEGFGYVMVEAMAEKIPVVAFDVGSSSEIVVHEKTGYIVPGRDIGAMSGRVIELLQNPGLRRQMGAEGRKRVEEVFHISRGIRQVEDLLVAGRKENDCERRWP
ncbi:MAG TPA: glycosyltransferase [Bacteroidetes bacterium]|nr:glycosyltransferase [Bacteroidota bacterium]